MKKPRFTLSMKDQKGQVAIFVALIFQVIFVFFALLINVGLIVHHKINLQQSTDLAAYYGAMKQAESLNAIAHINFQIRQAWKLLAWRYRIVGTFGFQREPSGASPILPLIIDPTNSKINNFADVNSGSCAGLSTASHPFFCIGHGGMKQWKGGGGENLCKINCDLMAAADAFSVSGVKNFTPSLGGDYSSQVTATINYVNTQLDGLCRALPKENMKVLAKMLIGYRRETAARSKTLLMLAGNLSNSSETMLDLDGEPVIKGVTNTLQNNLTEANRSGMASANIRTYNGLNGCDMNRGNNAGSVKDSKKEFLKRIEFEAIQLIIHSCDWDGNQRFYSGSIFKPGYDGFADGTPITLGPRTLRTPQLNDPSFLSNDIKDEILSLIHVDNEKFTVGYEKNPWCPAYYYVSATSEPTIPFLPLAKVKLSASSVAKPFGGSVGPWFGKSWERDNATSSENILPLDTSKQTDETLPILKNAASASLTRQQSSRLFLNFSRFVGDQLGLSDPQYVSEFHAALMRRMPTSNADNLTRSPKLAETPVNSFNVVPTIAPSLDSWDDAVDMTNSNYDPISKASNSGTFLRDLEIFAIAPNQFDLSYYSIDPDFYNNYYARLSKPDIFSKLKSSAGMGPSQVLEVRPDFGNNKLLYKIDDFSVRNQIQITKQVFAQGFSTGLPGSSPRFIDVYPYVATKQASLLTGWTFVNLLNFKDFPSADLDSANTMSFGRCSDPWHKAPDEFESPVKDNAPPTSGNCITGGRTGYSVKLISPITVQGTIAQPLGGGPPGSPISGTILNPLPPEYLNIQ